MMHAFLKGKERGRVVARSYVNPDVKVPEIPPEDQAYVRDYTIAYQAGYLIEALRTLITQGGNPLNDNLEIVITPEIIEKLKKEHGRSK